MFNRFTALYLLYLSTSVLIITIALSLEKSFVRENVLFWSTLLSLSIVSFPWFLKRFIDEVRFHKPLKVWRVIKKEYFESKKNKSLNSYFSFYREGSACHTGASFKFSEGSFKTHLNPIDIMGNYTIREVNLKTKLTESELNFLARKSHHFIQTNQ